ncbi:hypothetical protein [Pimelobacter simplex]|uniref:hypothetical protein n=1 Tax=Nocardioides simplex TaxID=2045 RepID=UPI001932C590|nr:hypothetical protein [Pimelobacter simplex]
MSQYDARATPSDADLTDALREFSASVAAFTAAVADLDRVVERADGLLTRADKLLAPIAATQQVGDQLKVAGQLASQVASAAVKRGVAAAKTVTGP